MKSHSTNGDGWSAGGPRPGGRTEPRARHRRRQRSGPPLGPPNQNTFGWQTRTRGHCSQRASQRHHSLGCEWLVRSRARAGQCGPSCALAMRVESRPAATAPALVLPSNARGHVVQRPRPRSLPAQLSSPARPLCPSPPSIIIRQIVRGGILSLGAARVARAVAFGLCWPPGSLRSSPANQLIPMSPPCPLLRCKCCLPAGAVL